MLTLILDTNVVLDWLVFRDPLLAELTNAVKSNRVNLLTHDTALNELRRVLNYPTLKLDVKRQNEVYGIYQSLCRQAIMPSGFTAQNLLTPLNFPICRDRDDQLFLALTLHAKADGLVSRDKALLALRKRVLKFGLTILDLQQMRAKAAIE